MSTCCELLHQEQRMQETAKRRDGRRSKLVVLVDERAIPPPPPPSGWSRPTPPRKRQRCSGGPTPGSTSACARVSSSCRTAAPCSHCGPQGVSAVHPPDAPRHHRGQRPPGLVLGGGHAIRPYCGDLRQLPRDRRVQDHELSVRPSRPPRRSTPTPSSAVPAAWPQGCSRQLRERVAYSKLSTKRIGTAAAQRHRRRVGDVLVGPFDVQLLGQMSAAHLGFSPNRIQVLPHRNPPDTSFFTTGLLHVSYRTFRESIAVVEVPPPRHGHGPRPRGGACPP